jgi:drug/metabolite transporter (DMT)-like permease
VLLRVLKDLNASVVMLNSGFFAILYTLLILLLTNDGLCAMCSIQEKVLVIILAVLSFFGQYFLTTSLKYEDSNVISIARSTTIIFSFICQILFFDEVLTLNSVFGSILISLSVFILTFKKYALSKDSYVSRNIVKLLQ